MCRLGLCVLFAVACNGGASSPRRCAANSDCESGSVCKSDGCRKLCTVDADCGTGEVCDEETVCRPGVRDLTPRIEGIDGTGTADGRNGHTDRRVRDRLIIYGRYLEGGTVTLSKDGTDHPAEVCASRQDGLEVLLPAGLEEGEYTLTVATQAGTCSTPLPTLQGEIGPTGATGATGPLGPTGDSGADGLTSLIDVTVDNVACTTGGHRIFAGLDADASAALDPGERQFDMLVCNGAVGPTGPTGPAGSPDTPQEVLTKLITVDGAGSGLDADTVDGWHFDPSSFDAATNIKAYIDKLACEMRGGTYLINGSCDPNMQTNNFGPTFDAGDTGHDDTSCPVGYGRVCTVHEIMQRAPLIGSIPADWYWANPDTSRAPAVGNMEGDAGSRDPCPAGLAPLVRIQRPRTGARYQVIDVICHSDTVNYAAVCCR